MKTSAEALNTINIAIVKKEKIAVVKRNRIIENLCSLLLDEGYIEGFNPSGSQLIVFLKYDVHGYSIVQKVSFVYSKSRMRDNIESGRKILSTDKGLVFADKNLGFSLGGILLFVVK